MLYRNDKIEITDEYVKGSIKDIMEYFRYEIASQSMSGTDFDYEDYIYNVTNIIDLLDNLYKALMFNAYTENDIVKVMENLRGGFMIERDED